MRASSALVDSLSDRKELKLLFPFFLSGIA